ncbi:MAG TPA: hypothetical protein VGV90_14635 [Solirubrobacteraceae bacterium]|nr:hypothetical protein [Solirubrobacteraceae bacterium]
MSWPRGDRWIGVVDLFVVLWVAVWLLLGLRVHDEVEGLTELSTTISRAGGAVEQTGRALGALDIPFVGDRIDRAAAEATGVGRETRISGRTARDSIADLSTLLGLSVALIPSSAILLVYLPVRVARVRERRALRRLLARFGDDPALERLLAHRALQTMSYRQLQRSVGERPWVDLAEGRYAALAAAERRRLDLEQDGR